MAVIINILTWILVIGIFIFFIYEFIRLIGDIKKRISKSKQKKNTSSDVIDDKATSSDDKAQKKEEK